MFELKLSATLKFLKLMNFFVPQFALKRLFLELCLEYERILRIFIIAVLLLFLFMRKRNEQKILSRFSAYSFQWTEIEFIYYEIVHLNVTF